MSWFGDASIQMMGDHPYGIYGDRWADTYDERHLQPLAEDTAGAVSFLTQLAGNGPALELGVGTGRVALPLADAGVEVHGIDASERMLDGLRAKPGAERIDVTVGNFADFSLPIRFRLVYVVFNTFFDLVTQDDQVSCFDAVARHLRPDGSFVMQAFVPDATRFDVHNQRVAAESVGIDEVVLEASEHDPFAQRVDAAFVVIRDGGVQLWPARMRYAHVPELDLMARLAGLNLRERWAGWDREPFPSRNWTHVSVWELGAERS